jgi:NAD-specific glutamate dehydrogenase.
LKVCQALVVFGHFPLALQDVHVDVGLVVHRGGEHTRAPYRNGGVARDDPREHAAGGFHAQGEWGHVEQQHVLLLARKHRALQRRAHRYRLVGIDRARRLLAKEARHYFVHARHARLTAHQDHLVDVLDRPARVLQHLLDGWNGPVEQILAQRLQPAARERGDEVLGPLGARGDEGQVHLGLQAGGQLVLGPLRRLTQALQGHALAAQVDAGLGLEPFGQQAHYARIDVFPAQEAVAARRLDLVHALVQMQERDIECAAAQIVDRDLGVRHHAQTTEGQRRGGGLVDDAPDVEPRDAPRVLGGLALAVAEVGRHGDHGIGDRLAQVLLGGLPHLVQNEGRELRRRIVLALDPHPGVAVAGRHHFIGGRLGMTIDLGIGAFASHQALDR